MEARQRRQHKSQVARDVLRERFELAGAPDAASEARRQSLLVSGRKSERDALAFVAAVTDGDGWR